MEQDATIKKKHRVAWDKSKVQDIQLQSHFVLLKDENS
jgi:hypothetical protein